MRSFEGRSRMRSDPAFEQLLVQVLAHGERRAILELRFGVGAERKRYRAAGREARVENCREQVVLAMVQPALAFHSQIVISIPFATRLSLRDIAEQVNGNGALASDNAQTAWNRRHRCLPVACLRRGVNIAIVDENFDFQFRRFGGIDKFVADESCVRAVLHPYALFEYGVGAGESPHRHRSRKTKLLDESKSLRLDAAARPTISPQGVIAARVAEDF